MWNHDLSEAPRDGSHVLMATTDGKRYLTRWLEPTKFTPKGRFDGFPENAKTLLAWASVPEHPNAVQFPEREQSRGNGSRDHQHVHSRQPDGAKHGGQDGVPAGADHASFIVEDCGSGA